MSRQPSKEQWTEIEKQLDRQYDTAYLRCDGYLVQAGMERTGKNKLEIFVYVNGYFKGAWTSGEAEEPRRFWRPSTRGKWPAKFIRKMEKIIGKRKCKAEGYYEKRTTYLPTWSRPSPFIRHLIKHNESIEILEYETYKTAVDEMITEEKA